MKIWITGAQGLVGRTLQDFCQAKGISFVATGREVDISSLAAIHHFFQMHADITHIINCAAYTQVDLAETQKEEAFKANALGPENLGQLALFKKLKIVHLSTDYVFDSESAQPLKENHSCQPSSIYAKTKHEGELRLLAAFPQACIIRTSWVFGPGGKTFISSLWNKLYQEKKITVADDQVNRVTYSKDLAAAVFSLLSYEGIYHFANHGIVSRYEVARQMKQFLQESGQKLMCEEITPVSASAFPVAAVRPKFSVLDTQKIENSVGVTPRFWKEALKEYVHEQLS